MSRAFLNTDICTSLASFYWLSAVAVLAILVTSMNFPFRSGSLRAIGQIAAFLNPS